jgi:S-DNA-T family DNA segregation ATPase FtsK/SpoIIIE
LAKILPQSLKHAVQEQSLSIVEAQSIETAWSAFASSYKEAIQSLAGSTGIADESLLRQTESYHGLIKTLLACARGDKNRSNILAPVLRIGCVKVTGGKPSAIIAPWHPLRLAAIAVKSRQVSGLLKYILNSEQTDFGDSKLFFSDLRIELEHPYYPEICVEYAGEEPKLLCATDTVNDYSLMERPIREQFDQTTHENPADAAGKLLDLTKRYLELLPHEKTNLTVVLYNCDSARLPQFVVSKLSEMEEERGEVRCQVTLRHQNTEKLNRLYREMIEGFDADPDAYVASEMSQDYLAKLRIGVMADEAPMRDEKEGRVADIVFLQDVISRQAQEKWETAPTANGYPGLLDHVPPRWSRKRALRKDELKSTAYLVCPRQPQVGESYVQAIACLVKSEDAQLGQVPLPVRQIFFSSQETSKIFEEVHRLGEWVVNYDNLIERRQLMNKGVKVIRYQQSQTDGRNLLVSSKAPLNLLEVLVRRRLNDLSLGLSDQEIGELTKRFIDEANVVSGDIVLRAAKRGHFASELIGVVLSKILVAAEMGDSAIGWYFLDDYASWLGQKEEQIADIMAICPKVSDGKRFLKIIITESKYITEDGLSDSRKKSQKQLWETVARIESAVFGNPGRLDRDLWLSRISDIMLEGIEQGINSPIQIEEWRNDLRVGRLQIDLSGYSHVFISGPNGSTKVSEQVKIPKVERCYQEVFSRGQVRELVLAFHRNQLVSNVREKLGDETPWLHSDPKLPAERVSWHLNIAQTATSQKDVAKGDNISEGAKTSASNSITGQRVDEDDVSAPDISVKIDSEGSDEGSPVNQPVMETSKNQSDDSTGSKTRVTVDEPVTEPTLNDVGSWIERSAVKPEEDASAQAWLKEVVQRLRNALISYELQAQVVGQRLTPNAALIRLRGTDRLTVGGIEKKQTQLLTTHALKVINVSALPGEVLVSIARPQRQAISLAEVWERRKLNLVSGVNLSLVVGVKEIDGEILYLNLAREFEGLQQHAPHTLIAGATGSGKSVLLRNLLLDVCSFNSPQDAKIYLIDPKSGVDYFALEDLPHLAEGIIDDRSKAIEVLEGLVAEMDRRYSHFRQARVSDLMTYNAKLASGARMPVLLAVHDEFAEWMLIEEYRDAISAIVQRLGAKARAAGIHLIFAAQRPDATVFPMQLRDNLGNRLILKVESIGTSEIALGQKGAELLLGKGHVIARLTGESDLIYAQVPFVSNEDAAELVNVIKKSGA